MWEMMLVQYLQYAVTVLVAGYIFLDWIRLGYYVKLKEKERPGLLQLNWSVEKVSGITTGKGESKPAGYLDQQNVAIKADAVER